MRVRTEERQIEGLETQRRFEETCYSINFINSVCVCVQIKDCNWSYPTQGIMLCPEGMDCHIKSIVYRIPSFMFLISSIPETASQTMLSIDYHCSYFMINPIAEDTAYFGHSTWRNQAVTD